MNDKIVYTLNDKNGVFYVGIGDKIRPYAHLKPSVYENPQNTSNPFLYYKIRKMVKDGAPPVIDILYESVSIETAKEKEIELIEKYGRRFKGGGVLFNLTRGGDVGGHGKSYVWSEERKTNFRAICKTRRIYDPTYEKLYDDYIEQNKTRKQIAEENNVSIPLVKNRLGELGIHKPKSKRYPEKHVFDCHTCGKTVITPQSKRNQRFCSHACRRQE